MEEDIRDSFKRQKTLHAWERDDSKVFQFNRFPAMEISPVSSTHYLPPFQSITHMPNLGTFTPYHVSTPTPSWNMSLPALQIPQKVPEGEKVFCNCGNFVPSFDEMGRNYHKESFMCSTCKIPLQIPHFKDGGMFCEKHAHGEDEKVAHLLDLKIFVRSNPETHQIANYNVYPAPSIALEKGISSTQTVVASLVDNHSGIELTEGFQSGFRRVIKQGGNYLVFTGLKINKMGRIKNELRQRQIMKFDSFQIRFRIGNESWDSTPFKLVSSCTQLPKEIRSKVRPSKKAHHDDEEPDNNWLSITDTVNEKMESSDSPSPGQEAESPKQELRKETAEMSQPPKVASLSSQSKGPGSIQFLLE